MANAFAAMNGLYLEDLKVGMSAMFGKTVTEADIMAFAGVSGDTTRSTCMTASRARRASASASRTAC